MFDDDETGEPDSEFGRKKAPPPPILVEKQVSAPPGLTAPQFGQAGATTKRGAINKVRALDHAARKVVGDLFRSVTVEIVDTETQEKSAVVQMTAPVANAIITALRFRSELYAAFESAEEIQKLRREYIEIESRFKKFREGLMQ